VLPLEKVSVKMTVSLQATMLEASSAMAMGNDNFFMWLEWG
jgi:hypothetical protein